MKEKVGDNASMRGVIDMANDLDEQMKVIENNIHMTKNQSYQDPLNFGIRINNRIAFLMADQQRGDYPPTDQAIEFRDEVFKELDKELSDLNALFDAKIPIINSSIAELGIKIL